MTMVRIGINGFGRIGRAVLRIAEERGGIEVVGINDLTDDNTLAHLLRYDSAQGRFDGKVETAEGSLIVNGRKIPSMEERDPSKLPWGDLGADIVIEATGVFRTRDACAKHIAGGAKKVILTVPPKDEIDAIVVLGVNDDVLKPEHQIVSNASCTTNCLAPMVKVLHDTFGINKGVMNTIHAYTNDQNVVDAPHSDLRRARAAAVNIIPTTTGAARAVGKVMPELAGKLDGFALRVPVPTGSVVDLTAELAKNATVEEINSALKAASEGALKGILAYTDHPIVSTDIIGTSSSCIVDSQLTMVQEGNMAKVVGWYDNEWGYSNRVVDLINRLAS
ncbi:MAG: type I glyceraldehyde-3-phosphate dehydrogenase [Planctomycetota bacterium]|jgi:glyceraldehyde 3-phosphate dehydrogenase